MMTDNIPLNLKKEIYDSLMEWEDGEMFTKEDVQNKTNELIKIFRTFINEKLESDGECQHKSFDTMVETWYKNGKIAALRELSKEIIVN